MKKLIQLRVSKRLVGRMGLPDAVLESLERHIADNFAIRWSLSKEFLLVMDTKDRIKAIDFSRQWNTLTKQSIAGDRLKVYINLPVEILRKR